MGETVVNLIKLFTSFRGRISRKSWWLATIAIEIVIFCGSAVLNPASLSFDSDVVVPAVPSETIWLLLMVIPSTAITVKRFNDRDWPYWLGYAVALPDIIFYTEPYFGAYTPWPELSYPIAFWISVPTLLFILVENGFMRGTKGPNRYGPDPLERTQEGGAAMVGAK